MFKIPESVTHAELMAAQRPLLDLLGVTEQEVFAGGISIHPSYSTDRLATIAITLAARGDDDGERPRPRTKAAGVSEAVAATAELAWHCYVKVV